MAKSYLGGEDTLRSLTVELFAREMRATVWVTLRDASLDAQLDAIGNFDAVQEAFEDELETSLRFGAPDRDASRADIQTLVSAAR